MTGETGRGREQVTPDATAQYFFDCVLDYMDVLSAPRDSLATYWRDRRIVEYGPGDIPGVALLLAALGARSVLCVDRFALVRFDDYQQRTLAALAKLLPDDKCRARLRNCFGQPDNFASGLKPVAQGGAVSYAITRSGLLGLRDVADMVISRAVLEHVDDLSATCRDMAQVLVPGGTAVHQVDLKSHGLHRGNRLDFLTWPEPLWKMMFSGKGAPNRLRVDSYREAIREAGIELLSMRTHEAATPDEVAQIRPYLARPFRDIHSDDLTCLSFWMVCRRR
jgi:SAM-dependent methyltransferase